MNCVKKANILIVEDQEMNARLLTKILCLEGYTNIVHVEDSRRALAVFQGFRPDLILLDLHMPYLDGFAVMAQLNGFTCGDYLPILMLTSDADPLVKQRALACGASDFITKPFNTTQVLLRTRNFLKARQLHLQILAECGLEEPMRTGASQQEQIEILERLALAAEYGDLDTSEHMRRVACIAARIARKMGMTEEEVLLLERAATLHDIGKISVPDHILSKPGKLSDGEFEVLKTHAEAGARVLHGGQCEVIEMAEIVALTHHERFDGSGYPCGLKGEEIPLVGRIVALADVFDALTHDRPYKKGWSREEALVEIKCQSGRHFDPAVVEAFLSLELRCLHKAAPFLA